MQPMDSCRLMHLVLPSFVCNPFTDTAYFDVEKFRKYTYLISLLNDDAVDLEIAALTEVLNKITKENKPEDSVEIDSLKKLIKSGRRGRRCGIGFTGLADTVAMLNMKFGSEDSIDFIKKIMWEKEDAELNCQIDMAILRGPFKGWDPKKELVGNDYYNQLDKRNLLRSVRMNKYGRRNVSFSTVAPTGTVSLMAQTTSGIEPLFRPFYERKRKVMNESDKYDFIDATGEKFITSLVIHKGLKDWITKVKKVEVPTTLKELEEYYKQSPYYGATANDISTNDRVKIQAIVQTYTTHSISSTVNLPKETSPEEIDKLYFKAWESGLKGITIYRDGCRDGILTEIKSKTATFNQYDAPKRPEVLDGESFIIKVKGVSYAVVVGLLDNKPYEVFASECPPAFIQQKGTIRKVKKRVYQWEGNNGDVLSNMICMSENAEERLCTLSVSMLLRTGAKLPFVIKMLKKASPNITSFAAAISRVLSKYIPKGESGEVCPECGSKLIREAGCIKCENCSYSVCLLLVKHDN